MQQKRLMRGMFFLFFVFSFIIACTQTRSIVSNKENNEKVVYGLIKRVLPAHSDQFMIGFIKKNNGQDCFEIESICNGIMLWVNNGISIAGALKYYL